MISPTAFAVSSSGVSVILASSSSGDSVSLATFDVTFAALPPASPAVDAVFVSPAPTRKDAMNSPCALVPDSSSFFYACLVCYFNKMLRTIITF